MEGGKTLILEGLTADVDDHVKSKLTLYFKNKRRSGGEISDLRGDPTDSRRVVLVYLDDKVRNDVLLRKTHLVDLKGTLGVVTLRVTLPEDAQQAQPALSSQADKSKKDAALLCVTSERNRAFLEMFFDQWITDPILRRHGKNTWILQMSNKSDMECVSAEQLQQYGISVEVYEEKEEEDMVDRRRYVLSGLGDDCFFDSISIYISSCSHRAEHIWEAVGGDSIVVTFKEDIDVHQFMEKTFTKMFNNKKIEARRLELTKSVIVQGDMSQISEDILRLYFSNKNRSGGDMIKSIVHVNQNKSAVITFEDWMVAHRVAEGKHTLMGENLVAQLFYPDLQSILTGQTHLQSNFSTDITVPVTSELLSFISHNEFLREELTSALQRVHAMVSFNIISDHPQLELKMSMDKQSLGLLRHGPSWEINARREVQTHLEKYMVEHILMEAEVWKAVKGSCPEVNGATVLIYFKICTSELVVVGRREEVETLVKELKSKMEKARDELQVMKNTVEKEIQLDSKERLGLILDLAGDELVDVDLSKNNENFTIHLKGLSETVQTAENVIQKVQDTLTSKKLDSSHNLTRFVQSLDLQKFQNYHFSQDNIMAVVICSKESVTVLAKKGDIDRAEKKLKEVIKQEGISISGEYDKVTFGAQWKTFYADLTKELESTQNCQNILIEFSAAKIELCGFRSVVDDVLAKVKGYLENKKLMTKDVPLKTVQEVEFVCMKLSADPQLRALEATILSCLSPQSPCLKVTATSDQIEEAIDVVNMHISRIITRKHMYCKAGEAKILEKNESVLQIQAKGLGCNLKLSKQMISQQFSYELKDGVTLTLSQGNIAKQTSDALICPLVNTCFNNPVAQQFLENGGPEIKNAIDALEKVKQSLMAGDVVMTNTGTLKSKKLIYAAIPVWGNTSSDLNSKNLVTAVLQSLLKAASNQCVSVGMPALGCGTFGFPVKDSCEAIMKGISSFIGLGCGALTTIHLTEFDPKTVAGFKSALECLGYHPTDPTKPKTPFFPPSSSASQIAALPSSQVPNTIVIGRVSVILKKADITKETVDVIVNSNNQNLDLDTGVSGAIFKAAGQSVVDECKKHGSQVAGRVVLTGGGNLNCKHIAQIAGPAKITASIPQVLQLCESKQAATLSIPTIGTGRGGCDPKDSAKTILQGVKDHLSCTHFSSLKKIFVVAFEDKTYDSMKKYFNKPRHSKTHRGGTQMAVPVSTLGLLLNQVKIKDALIELKKGNITAETVKAIVNSTNEDVNLKHGVSGAIFNAAGSAVEDECANIRPLRGNDAGVTSGGGLQCDFIIHIVGPKSVAQAVERVKNVLKHCEDKKIPTVSFPAIGTGGGGLKFKDSVSALLEGIKDHLSKHNFSVLKQIFLVIDQVNVMQECQHSLLLWSQADDNSSNTSCEEDNSAVTTAEVLMGPVKVKVFCGDITKEKTAAIVNSTNTTLNLTSGVSGAILKAAGQAVVDECKNLGTQPNDGVVITKPGNLTAKHIIHMVGQTKEKDITSSMLKVFKMCEDHKIQSVAFPALGTGAGNLCAVDAGKAMVTAVEEHIKTAKTTSLKNVHIVIFQTNMIQEFRKSLKKSKKVTPAAKTSAPQRAVPSTQQPSLCLASACRDVSFPKVEVEVLGCCSSEVEKVKELVDELLTNEWKLYPICSPYLHLLLNSEKQAIVALSQTLQVCVSVMALDKATASGKVEDALLMVIEIQKYLQNAKEWAIRQEEEKRLRETVRWEVSDGETWAELDQTVSLDLEHALHKKEPSVSYTQQQQTYTVNLDNMERTDRKGNITRIKRTLKADSETAVIDLPPNWDNMENKTMDVVDLSPTSKQYKMVQENFLKTSKEKATSATFTVVKIQRIQSKEQWQRYAVKKQMLDKKYPQNKNEIDLYHGTTAQICQRVNSYGFNRSFCGRNATMYGNGTYFATHSWYSCADQYSNPDTQGVKYMYQARVLVGKPCLGTAGMVEPAPLDPSNPLAGLHDCAVNNLQNPFIYVVFSDAGVYPEYLISFKKS